MLDGTSISQIADVLARTFNIVLFGAGAVFIMMVLYSAYKYSMALGDPKMLDGAKQSLTYSIFGLLVVVGFFFIVSFVANYLGLATGVLTNPSAVLRNNLNRLQETTNTGASGNGILILPGGLYIDLKKLF
uniref:Uncharacterized protein n=1 Tax=candidate division WWE3 bacterium TaxID=2053526 RepID=A0A7C4TJ69_UNCKA